MHAILVDVTKCTGCEQCVNACRAERRPVPALSDLGATGDALSATQVLAIEPLASGRFARRSCLHCLEPSCVAACLVGGLRKTAEGPVLYDRDKCIGCRYCMLACPYHVPRYEWDRALPYVQKCDMCWARLQAGRVPACVEACPNGALRFGERGVLVEQARNLIASQPGRYLPRVWGEHEWGGASVLYVSDVDLAVLDFPEARTAAIPALTDPLIEKTPFIGTGVAFGLWALASIIARRNTVMAAERDRLQQNMPPEPGRPRHSTWERPHE